MATGDVDRHPDAVFLNIGAVRGGAPQRPATRCQAFKLPDIGVRAFVDVLKPGGNLQRVGDFVTPFLGAGGQKLRHQNVTIAVDDQARQSVGFAMHQSHAVTRKVFAAACNRPGDAVDEKSCVDLQVSIECPNTRANLRLRAVSCQCENPSAVAANPHGFARQRLGRDFVDRA